MKTVFMNISVRPAVPSDLSRLRVILFDAWQEELPETEERFAEILSETRSRGHHVIVAAEESDRAPLGVCICEIQTKLSGARKAHVQSLAVDTAHRGRGVGTALLDECLRVATRANCKRLCVCPMDDKVEQFYRGFGFAERRWSGSQWAMPVPCVSRPG